MFQHSIKIFGRVNLQFKTKQSCFLFLSLHYTGLFISPLNMLGNQKMSQLMKTVMITSFDKAALCHTSKTCDSISIETNAKVDRTHRKRRIRVKSVATSVPRINPMPLFLLGFCE